MPQYIYECRVGDALGPILAGQPVPHLHRWTVSRGIREPEVIPDCSVCGEPMRRIYDVPVVRINWKGGR